MSALFSQRTVGGPDVGWGWGTDAIRTELAASRLMYGEGIQDQEQWTHYMEGCWSIGVFEV